MFVVAVCVFDPLAVLLCGGVQVLALVVIYICLYFLLYPRTHGKCWRNYTGLTFSARGPFGLWASV